MKEKYWYLEEELNLTPLLKREQSHRGNVTEVGPGLCVHRGRDGEVVVWWSRHCPPPTEDTRTVSSQPPHAARPLPRPGPHQ